MSLESLIGICIAAVVLIYLIRALAKPLVKVGQLAIRTVLSAVALAVVNLIGTLVGFHIGLNLLTALTVGVLGVPGFLLLIAARWIVH